MFSVGTRVSVYLSTASNKKLGPKPHSLGYIGGAAPINFIPSMSNFPIKGQSFVISTVNVVFTRYGREQRSRVEMRSFTNIMPVFMNSKGIEIRQRISDILDIFTDIRSVDSSWLTHIYQKENSDYIGVLLPIRCHKPARMDYKEIEAWSTAIFRNEKFNSVLRANANLPTFKALYTTQPKLFIWAAKASSSSDSRNSLLSWARENDDRLTHLVNFLQIVNACINKRLVENDINSMQQYIKSVNSQMPANVFVPWFVNSMFDGDKIMNRKQTMVKDSSVARCLKDMTNCMRIVRSTYLNIKPKYV